MRLGSNIEYEKILTYYCVPHFADSESIFTSLALLGKDKEGAGSGSDETGSTVRSGREAAMLRQQSISSSRTGS